jgi:hypothetical protein
LAVSAGVVVEGRWVGKLLVIGADLPQGLTTGRAWIEGLVQESQEAEFGGEEALTAVLLGGVGAEMGGFEPAGQEALQVMEGLGAQALEDGFKGGMELAEERSGGIHISVYRQIHSLTVKPCLH